MKPKIARIGLAVTTAIMLGGVALAQGLYRSNSW